ncbi:ras and EF-hand domain-containing protein isoform X2 [Strongylocentrotus purpuratus]|uniref:EF-hand domain-containing protein n=1 Tax=Strongylocentrotus purpuratus TaxID=7668 RepID=A0A7M7PGI1_STRPU|nr:ras and EF-hand domain-containing protein isoform X2 [Strongylocentrotus purpuratus]
MGDYDEGLASGESFPSHDEIKTIVEQKARELFMVCDVEQKGFVSKRDMQRLVDELPLMPDQLEEVFDSLDDDKNGYLTLEEFTEGFGGFLGLKSAPIDHIETDDGEYTENRDHDEIERDFKHAMESIGATGVIAEHDSVKDLWKKLNQDEPGLLTNFEDFIQHVCLDKRTSQLNTGELENALKSRDTIHQQDIKHLYEEMERQIRMEKEKILSEEKEKERKIREQLEHDMQTKDEQLNSLLNKQAELEHKLYELSLTETEVKEENESLQEQNEHLSMKLDSSQTELVESKTYLKEMNEKHLKDKRERVKSNVKIAQGIMQERESLSVQLEKLKAMNQQLQDDRDMRLSRSLSDPSEDEKKKTLVKQGSIMSNYFEEGVIGGDGGEHIVGSSSLDGGRSSRRSSRHSVHRPSIHGRTFSRDLAHHLQLSQSFMYDDDGECEVDDAFLESSGLLSSGLMSHSERVVYDEVEEDEFDGGSEVVRRRSVDRASASRASADRASAGDKRKAFNRQVVGETKSSPIERSEPTPSSSPEGQRAEPVGAHTPIDQAIAEAKKLVAANRTPERLYKVVFVGDSGVGKTSIIHRFCTDTFTDSFSATIGVDFQVKSLSVCGSIVAMQLWDTAGQERFRSITRHYFRKADGIVILYDVTSETSFLNIRNWMNSIEETTDGHVVKMLLGNKCDCTEDRQIKEEVGHSLSESYKCDFYEVSAKTGSNVTEAFTSMSKLLLLKEDEEIQNSLNLTNDDGEGSKRCCESS